MWQLASAGIAFVLFVLAAFVFVVGANLLIERMRRFIDRL